MQPLFIKLFPTFQDVEREQLTLTRGSLVLYRRK